MGIKIIDKSSGLIVSNISLFSATIEKTGGGLVDSTAYLVVPYIVINGKRQAVSGGGYHGPYAAESKLITLDVQGEWNVRIKPNGSGSIVNVNVNNVTYRDYDVYGKAYYQKLLTGYKSTGIFEKTIYELVK